MKFSFLITLMLLSISLSAQLPSKTEAKKILQNIHKAKPVIDQRKSKYSAIRTVSINSIFYSKEIKWSYSHNPKAAVPYTLILNNGKKPTPLQAFNFKQAIEREIFYESQNMASQITVVKAIKILDHAVIQNVRHGVNASYVLIDFTSDLSKETSPGYNPYKNMTFTAVYNSKSKQVERVNFDSKGSVTLPEEADLKLAGASGYLLLKYTGSKTYVSQLNFEGNVRYKIASIKVKFSEVFTSIEP